MKKLLITLTLCLIAFPAFAQQAVSESAYDRVVRMRELRCGYIVWPPLLNKEAGTNRLSGMNYDYMEALAKSLGLKVRWLMNVGVGQQIQALRTGQIDAICAGERPLVPEHGRWLYYTKPLVYLPSFLYVRKDDRRFDANPNLINDPGVKFAYLDNDTSEIIATSMFPKANPYKATKPATPEQMIRDVADSRADVMVMDSVTLAHYLSQTAYTLRAIPMTKPVAVLPNNFSVLRGRGGTNLMELLNQGIDNLRHYGSDAAILDAYQNYGFNWAYRVPSAYEVKK